MVIAFASEPQVICPFVGNRTRLLAAIDSIRPTDGGTKITEAVRIARAFATSTDAESMGRSTVSPARLVLFTDGKNKRHRPGFPPGQGNDDLPGG